MPIYAGVEAGGTKFVCGVGTGPDDLVSEPFPTTTAVETIARVEEFFRKHPKPAAVGVGSFGPIDLDRSSPTWGHITMTPKLPWRNFNLAAAISRAAGAPVAFDTDVNAAALGEHHWGAAQGLETFLYLTVGTGIGGGAMANGRLLHGLMHPEMGHLRIPHDLDADPFLGLCPSHQDCLEGLASGPAIEKRWETRGENLAPDHPAWELEARYLALGVVNWILTLSPQRIILGGGILQVPGLLPRIRSHTLALLNGYIQSPALLDRMDEYLVLPALGGRAGVLGAIALAQGA
jgi:fructokinase